MKKTKKAIASLAVASMAVTMIPFNALAAAPTRIAGVTAEDTAAAIAEQTGYKGTAILASSTSYGMVDALTAGPLAASLKAPILLTGAGNALDAATKAELTKLNVTKVYVTSGTAVIKQGVIDELKAMNIEVVELGGFDRAATAVNIAKQMSGVTKVAVANGIPDALSIGSIAAAANQPILLTDKDSVPASVADYLKDNAAITASDVIGGTGIISEAVKDQFPGATRHFGYTAYDTNNQVIQNFADDLEFDNIYVANGVTGIDALSGAPLAAQTKSAIVLTDGKTVPDVAAFTYSMSDATTVVTALGGEAVVPEAIRLGIAAGKVTPVGDLAILAVNALSEDGRFVEVEFNSALSFVDKSQFSIKKTGSGERVGLESATLSLDGKRVDLVAYDADSRDEILAGVKYTLTYTGNGQPISVEFERPFYLDDRDDARVIEIDADKKNFTVDFDSGVVTIEVPADVNFDYEYAVGSEVRVWYDGAKQLIDYEIVDTNKVLFDAFEVTKAGEIELQTADKKYDLSTDDNDNINTVYYLDGEKTGIGALNAVEYAVDYAKMILNDKGDIAYIYAYNFDDMMVVEEVDGNIVEGLGDVDLDLEDFVIVKEGKTIQIAALEEGDALYYSEKADNSLNEEGYAVVYNNSVTGEIETIYDKSFVVEGKKYNYDTIKFIDKDGEIVDEFDKDDAEDFETDEVTIYIDFNGDVRLLTGDQGDAGNDVGVLTTAAPMVYADIKGEVALELEYVTEDLEEKSKDVFFKDLDSVTVDGQKYDIEQDADENKDFIVNRVNKTQFTINTNNANDNDARETVTVADNTPIILTMNDQGQITDLEFFDNNVADIEADIEPGDSHADLKGTGDKKLKKDTIIFVAEDGAQTDADDVQVYQFSGIDFDIDKEDAAVYYNADGDVEFIVVSDTVAVNTTEFVAVVNGFDTTDGDVTRLVAYVNGKKTTYTVDKVDVTELALKKGQVVRIEVNDENDEVEDIFVPGDAEEFGDDYFLLNQTNPEDISSNKFTLDGIEYKTADNFQMIDATNRKDIKTVTSLRTIDGKKFHVILDAEGSRYVNTIVIIGDEDVADDEGYADFLDADPDDPGDPGVPAIKDFQAVASLEIGKKMVIVELDTATPENYNVAVAGVQLDYNTTAKKFIGDVPEANAVQDKVVVSEKPAMPAIKDFQAVASLEIGKKLVIVELDTATPENYNVAVAGVQFDYNTTAKKFVGDVPEADAAQANVVVSAK